MGTCKQWLIFGICLYILDLTASARGVVAAEAGVSGPAEGPVLTGRIAQGPCTVGARRVGGTLAQRGAHTDPSVQTAPGT